MAFIRFKTRSDGETGRPAPRTPLLISCQFERSLVSQPLLEGGYLACYLADGSVRRLFVAMTWDVLARLRSELIRCEAFQPDAVIIREVLRYWGPREYFQRIVSASLLPSENLVLDSLGGPGCDRTHALLQASSLLDPDLPPAIEARRCSIRFGGAAPSLLAAAR